MIRIKKFILCLLVLVPVFAGLLCGCNKVPIKPVQELFMIMELNVAERTSFSADVNINLDMEYKADGTEGNMVLSFEETVDTLMDTMESYVEGTMNVKDVYSEKWESYVVEEDEGYSAYSNIDGEWYYDEAEWESVINGPSYIFDIIAGLKDCTVDYGNNYIIETKADSITILNIMNSLYANVLESAFSEGIDTSGITGTVTVTLDERSNIPLSLKIDFDDCSDIFVGEGMFESAAINEFVMEVEFSGYNETEAISVPVNVTDLFKLPDGEDIYDIEDEEPETPEEPVFEEEDSNVVTDDSGYYELTDYEGDYSIKVKAPKGYVFSEESDSAMLFFDSEDSSDDNYSSLLYEMPELTDVYTKVDVEEYIENYYNFYGTDSAYVDMEYIDNQTVEVSGYKVNYSGMKYYYEGDEFTKAGYYIWYYYWVYSGNHAVICNVNNYDMNGYTDFDVAKTAELLFSDIVFE